MCDCYVQHLNEETRFSLHLGAHNPTCPAYRVSRDSVDRAHDEAFRKGFEPCASSYHDKACNRAADHVETHRS